ncbi:MAG: DUF169 domain-containing protein [Clostridiales bacterium]|jgi:uncharacterized protein (DUF169 family)|nr:DUF169 domain-containing protein [Clostridiales bacterium]
MPTISDINTYGEVLEKLLLLRYAPIAMKLIKSEDEIPESAIRPKKDLGEHLALCQAFAMVRRQRKSIAMLKEDHWCVWPLISYGLVEFQKGTDYYDRTVTAFLVEDPQKSREFFEKHYPILEKDKCIGFVLAPLNTADFLPDLVLIYCRPAQLRSLLMSVKYKTGDILENKFDAVDSCVHSTVPVIQNENYKITVPDPGEYERGLTDEDEMIFSVPANKLAELVEGLEVVSRYGMGYKGLYMEIKGDFPRPQFYDDLFKLWSLDQGEIWKH